MEDELLPCPFCGETPVFRGDAGEWHDDGRYMQLNLECCVTMTEGIGWRKARDMTVAQRNDELRAALTARWNRQVYP